MSEEIFNGFDGRSKTECYEFVKFRDRSNMITFIKRDKSRYSAGYNHLYGVKGLSHALRIEFTQSKVIVVGANLDVIHKAITDHRVIYLRELPSGILIPEKDARIDKISVVE